MPIHPRRVVLRSLILLFLVVTWTAPIRPAKARLASDPMAIISAVNALRAANGLPPYVVDQGLMAYALEHSRYQASLHTATHTHSDGSNVWQHGMDENIAVGMLGYLTPEYAVYNIWSDAIHMKTMIGYASGSVGAGVADDGEDEYYTLDVRPGGAATSPRTRNNPDPNATPTRPIPIVPLLTVTPRGDRWIIHTVGYGQSLWSVAIAYGVKMDQIQAWNIALTGTTEVYAGQKLYIMAPPNIWPTLTASPVGAPTDAGQTVTPGWAITEEPQAATEKAAYQTAAAQTQGPAPEGQVLQVAVETSVPGTEAPASIQEAQVTSSPTGAPAGMDTATLPEAGPLNEEAQGDNLPLLAGALILVGGSLMLVLVVAMIRKQS